MSKQKKYEPMVRAILEENPLTRDSDDALYLAYCVAKGIDVDAPLWKALEDPTYPNRDTISRVRRKLQANDERLCGSKRIRKIRADREEEFREYAKE